MRRGVPRCEVLIAVGDQRRERVHMVRVLYHWNLIRLREREKKDTKTDRWTVIERVKGRENRGQGVKIWV